ncbi:MAG TPA: periplasmic heavy metal sensor [Xanthomonadales bacterium]|nr:periplasmic heavy metal sensor [Xanthomonadales bacterium]
MTTSDPRFRWVLLLSVALNLLLAAVVGSAWLHHRGGGHGIGGSVRLPRGEVLEKALPEADRPALRAAYDRHRDDVRAKLGPLWEARREVRDALAAEPFDASRAATALATLREREGAVAAAVHGLLVDLSGSVSPEGRAAIAKLSSTRHGRHRRHHGDDAPKDAPSRAPTGR